MGVISRINPQGYETVLFFLSKYEAEILKTIPKNAIADLRSIKYIFEIFVLVTVLK